MACSAPWRRSAEFMQSNTLSSEAAVFVPSWEAPQAQTLPQQNCCLISLGAYSDDSDDSDAEPTPTPTPASRPWRASAPEFVPRVSAPEFVPRSLGSVDTAAFMPKSEASGAKSAPWRRSPATSPTKAESSMTLSTSGSSPSPTASSNDASSASSCASRSRSPTPPPQVKEEAGPLSLQALLRWRVTPEQPEAKLPSAAVPEPGTAAAAVAAYVAAAAAAVGTATETPTASMSWRRASEDEAAMSWRPPVAYEEKPQRRFDVSEDSWVARQTQRRRTKSSVSGGQGDGDVASDEDIVRSMKSILNKLTVEKFESLSVQLINCGIRNTFHVELLIQEVFEKATTQHHFIDMYADLCDLLNVHFSEHPMTDDTKKNFKKILLHCCQASFEKHLTPPKNLADLTGEDRAIAERTYKMRMLGNIKFVGALLVRKMLASKVMLAIMEELLQEPTSEALESLAALLTVVGPTFDHPDWAYTVTLTAIFKQVEKLTKKKTVDSRVRCLLKDVIDVRNLGWHDRRPKKIEGPLKLEQVAAKAAMESSGGWMPQQVQKDWETVGKERLSKLSSILTNNKAPTPCPTPTSASYKPQTVIPQKVEKTTKGTGAGAAMLEFLKNRDKPEVTKEEPVQNKTFDRESCKVEISATLAELRVSYDVPEAIIRIAEIHIPVQDQPAELNKLLSQLAEEGAAGARKAGFDLVAGLILQKHWKPDSAAEGVRSFVEESCPDLKYDVPSLPKILKEELHPALAPVVKAGLLKADLQASLISI